MGKSHTNSKIPTLESVKDQTVFVGLSGGVDSAVAAAIFKASGAKVVGVFMKNWAGEDGLQLDCPWEEDMRSAQTAAEFLAIEFRSYNFEKEYKQHVLDYFFQEYTAGRTPNPDILCNSEIKFKAFLEKAVAEGADMIATGHYAGKENRTVLGKEFSALVNAADHNKDQTYFLSGLNANQLAKAVFPLAKLSKPEVRTIAESIGLPNAKRKDSQGICFIGDLDVQAFLHKYIQDDPGDIVDIDTKKVVGKHHGIAFYTIGQREGLGIGGLNEPYYVVDKDIDSKIVYVGKGHSHPALLKTEVMVHEIHWLYQHLSAVNLRHINSMGLKASIRYRHAPQSGEFINPNTFKFDNPQRAVTPGQSLVIYAGDICLGRGVIAA